MKKFLLLVLCLSYLASCGKEEENEKHIGTWKLISSSIETEHPGGTLLETQTLDECQKQEKIIFSKTTYTSYSYEKQAGGSCLESVVEVPYTYSDKVLRFSFGGQSYVFIVEVGGTSLQILSDLGGNKKLVKIYGKQ